MSNPVFNFLQELINLISTKFSGKGDMPVSEDSKDAYKWLLEQMKIAKNKRVAEFKGPVMHNGKIYIFKYNAKYKDKLDYILNLIDDEELTNSYEVWTKSSSMMKDILRFAYGFDYTLFNEDIYKRILYNKIFS